MKKEPLHTNLGFSLVEVILATAVFAILVAALVGAYLYGQESAVLAGDRARAVLLAEEGIEAVRSIRNNNFSSLVSGTYGVSITNDKWELTDSADTVEGFTRSIEIIELDQDRREVSCNVTWQQNAQRSGSVTITSTMTNWQETSSSTSSCGEYAIEEGYTSGTCRKNPNQCKKNNEDHLPGGDQYCTETQPATTCCALQ